MLALSGWQRSISIPSDFGSGCIFFLFDGAEYSAEFCAERGAAESQEFCGAGLHIARQVHGLKNHQSVKPLDDPAIAIPAGLLENLFGETSKFLPRINSGWWSRTGRKGFIGHIVPLLQREKFRQECWACGQHKGFSKSALQFSDVAGPPMCLQFFKGFG